MAQQPSGSGRPSRIRIPGPQNSVTGFRAALVMTLDIRYPLARRPQILWRFLVAKTPQETRFGTLRPHLGGTLDVEGNTEKPTEANCLQSANLALFPGKSERRPLKQEAFTTSPRAATSGFNKAESLCCEPISSGSRHLCEPVTSCESQLVLRLRGHQLSLHMHQVVVVRRAPLSPRAPTCFKIPWKMSGVKHKRSKVLEFRASASR